MTLYCRLCKVKQSGTHTAIKVDLLQREHGIRTSQHEIGMHAINAAVLSSGVPSLATEERRLMRGRTPSPSPAAAQTSTPSATTPIGPPCHHAFRPTIPPRLSAHHPTAPLGPPSHHACRPAMPPQHSARPASTAGRPSERRARTERRPANPLHRSGSVRRDVERDCRLSACSGSD